MPLSPSSTIWYRSRGGDALRAAAGEVTVGLTSHWPCVTDFSGLSAYGLKAQEREMSTPPTLLTRYGTPSPFLPEHQQALSERNIVSVSVCAFACLFTIICSGLHVESLRVLYSCCPWPLLSPVLAALRYQGRSRRPGHGRTTFQKPTTTLDTLYTSGL